MTQETGQETGQETVVALAMDWGGTWCRIAAVTREGAILWQSRVRNAPDADQARLLADALALVQQAMDWSAANRRHVLALAVAAAGPVDADSGTLREPPNLPALNGLSLKSAWEPQLGMDVHVGNDANLAALGEYQFGAGLEARNLGQSSNTLVYVTVSTGIGGGVVDRARLLLGSRGLAAEVGHMVIDRRPDARECQCGNRGCLEALASGTSIASIARRLLAEPENKESILAELEPGLITSERVLDAAGQGDALARQILDDVIDALSTGLTNLLHLYNPDLLVLGGGVSFGLLRMGLLPRIYDRMLQGAMTQGHQAFQLLPSRLGEAPGILGAASLAWSNAPNSAPPG